jgi:MoxR-like ATPase
MNQALDELREILTRTRDEVAKVVIGQRLAVDLSLIAIFTNHHALVEGVPGVGKTLLVKTLSHTLGAVFNRIQFTPDLMPSDIIGTNIFNLQKNEFEKTNSTLFQVQCLPRF